MARILIIDDDHQMRAFLRNLLTERGHEVVEAPDGDIGSRLYPEEPADLIIIDIFMPIKEGLETIREFRGAFPNARIIAMSGGMSGQRYDPLPTARVLGARRTLTKPFRSEELLEAVREVLEELGAE